MNEFTIPVPIIASVIAGAVSLLVLSGNAWLSGHRERTNRQREMCLLSLVTSPRLTQLSFPTCAELLEVRSPKPGVNHRQATI